MANMIMMALLVMMALSGLGAATITIPVVTEVSAQGNMTDNMTGNMTDTGSGNVSSMVTAP